MGDMVWRDVIEHRTVWFGAALVAAATAMFTTVCLNAIIGGVVADPSVFTEPLGRSALLQTATNLLALSGGPAIVVLMTVLGTLVPQMREVHASWRLAGASPGQVLRIFCQQVILTSAVGAFVGALASLPLQGAANSFLGRGMAPGLTQPPGFLTVASILGSVLIVSIWGAAAALYPAWRASRTSPLAGRVPEQQQKPTRLMVIVTLAFIVLIQLPLLVPLVALPALEADGGDGIVQGLVTLLPAGQALVITIALLGHFVLARFMGRWTRLPGLAQWTPWRIARHMAVTRAAESTAIVLPLMIGIGLFASFNIVGTAARNAAGPAGAHINLFDGVLMLAPIGLIGAVGSASVAFMASRRRERDVTALRIAGASPEDSLAVFACEAVIYVVTAVIAAAVPALGTCGLMALALTRWSIGLDLANLELTGSIVVGAFGSVMTIGIMVGCAVVAWRRPLVTALTEG